MLVVPVQKNVTTNKIVQHNAKLHVNARITNLQGVPAKKGLLNAK